MTDRPGTDKPMTNTDADPFARAVAMQSQFAQAMFTPLMGDADDRPVAMEDMQHWAEVGQKLQTMWLQYQTERLSDPQAMLPYIDPSRWMTLAQRWFRQMPLAHVEQQKALWDEGFRLWEDVLGQYGIGPKAVEAAGGDPQLPRQDRRFADERWRAHPAFALLHQTYLFLAERVGEMVDRIEGLPADKREQLRFTTRAITEAASPANFPLTNPVVLERTLETRGDNLVKGMEHLLADLQPRAAEPHRFRGLQAGREHRGHPGQGGPRDPALPVDPVQPDHRESAGDPAGDLPALDQPLLHPRPQREEELRALGGGAGGDACSWSAGNRPMRARGTWCGTITSAPRSTRSTTSARGSRCRSVHAIGYCVAGTTLSATLAVLHRRGEQDKVKSATFFTAQVDFEKAGELLNLLDDQQMAAIEALAPDGYLDGRYMAAAFNMLRGTDLIWNYVVHNYMLGEDYPAFDLLHWNGDVTNLPAQWHKHYLSDLYRDNHAGRNGRAERRRHADRSRAGPHTPPTSRRAARITSPRPRASGG